MDKLNAARKAVVALVGVVVAFGLLDEGTGQDLVALLTALLVYAVPND